MISILCDVRLRTPHKFEWLTLDSCWGEDCVAPDVKDVVIKEFQNKGEYCHCWDDPDEVVRVVVKVTVLYNLGREAASQQNDKLDKVEDVKCELSRERWDVKSRPLSITAVVFVFILAGISRAQSWHFIHSQIVVEINSCESVHKHIVNKLEIFSFPHVVEILRKENMDDAVQKNRITWLKVKFLQNKIIYV